MGLSMPLEPEVWLADRKQRLEDGLHRLAKAVRNGVLPSGIIEDGRLRVERLEADVPAEADNLILDLYRRLPEARITDILMDVANETGFTDAFAHLRTGAPCKDRLGLLNVILAEGLNLGLSKMAGASSTHNFKQLARLSNWHVESEAINRALAMVIEAQAWLPGVCEILCPDAFSYAMGKRSSNIMASWLLTRCHSRTDRFHSTEVALRAK